MTKRGNYNHISTSDEPLLKEIFWRQRKLRMNDAELVRRSSICRNRIAVLRRPHGSSGKSVRVHEVRALANAVGMKLRAEIVIDNSLKSVNLLGWITAIDGFVAKG